jgi:hypothetical protein
VQVGGDLGSGHRLRRVWTQMAPRPGRWEVMERAPEPGVTRRGISHRYGEHREPHLGLGILAGRRARRVLPSLVESFPV